MVYRAIVILLFVAAMAILITGVASYWWGIPENTLWINSVEKEPRVRLAIIDGTVHVVYSGPRAVGKGLYKKEFGPFYVKRVDVGNVDATGLGVPFWLLFVVLMCIPFTAFVRGPYRRRRRRMQGLCIHCGYNLTGLTAPRCPECGRQFSTGISYENLQAAAREE